MKTFYSFLVLFCVLGQAHAKIHFKEVKFEKVNPQLGRVEIEFDDDVIEIPSLKFDDKAIHLIVPQSEMKSKISKSIELEKNVNINFVGERISKEDARLSILLPFSIDSLKKKIHVNLKGTKILLNFPLLKVDKIAKKVAEKDAYNEKYLQKLMDEKKIKR